MEENLGLAHLCARRFLGRGVEYDDLFQAGCVGLVKAAENFDTARGVKFSTYAVPVILGEVRRLFRDGGLCGSPGACGTWGAKPRRQRTSSAKRREKPLEWPRWPSAWAFPWRKPPWPWGWDRLPCPSPAQRTGARWTCPWRPPRQRMTERLTLYQILQTLEERDRKLIQYRYFQGKTQTQTAALLGMTQVQVSRREKKLLLFMRAAFDQ